MTAKEVYQEWRTMESLDRSTREELLRLAGDETEIEDRFGCNLSFGTGGMRGKMGVGTNRMNKITVCKATQGLADYIKTYSNGGNGVVIAFDSRRNSKEFAEQAALCLAANGVQVHVFSTITPTPLLSFAVRVLGCIAGIVITASHNPPEYNGYKVYWSDGAQVTEPKDRDIINMVNRVSDTFQIMQISKETAIQRGLYALVEEWVKDAYIKETKKNLLHAELLVKEGKNLRIVYTPLHGTGNELVCRLLTESGCSAIHVVKEQESTDGSFSTVASPNPEEKSAFALALQLAEQVQADLIFATDPDADRFGLYAREDNTGAYNYFTGNMSGTMILHYLLSQKKEMGLLLQDAKVVTTIVSGKMPQKVAAEFQVECIETLTGFKYIGEQIKKMEEEMTGTYLFGYEESNGCLLGTQVRDKDAIGAVLMICEIAAWCKSNNHSLCSYMEQLYETYGYYKEELVTITCYGQEGRLQIERTMDTMREVIPESFGSFKVLRVRDYQSMVVTELKTQKKAKTDLPCADVVYFELEHNAWCCFRPSGTESKMKLYIGVCERSGTDAAICLKEIKEAAMKLMEG